MESKPNFPQARSSPFPLTSAPSVQSEETYRLLFEHNPHPMWVCETQHLRYLAANEAAVRHYGYSREEFLRMTLKDIRPPEDLPILLAYTKHIDHDHDDSKIHTSGHWRHRKKNGELIDVEITWSTLFFEGQKAWLVMADDITQRIQLERHSAIFSELDKRLSLATSPRQAAQILADGGDALVGWTEFCLALEGPEEDVPRLILHLKRNSDRLGPSLQEALVDKWRELAVKYSGRPHAIEGGTTLWSALWNGPKAVALVGIRRDTKFTPTEEKTLYDLAGHSVGALERIRAEEGLRNSEALYHSLVENLPQAIFRKDLSGRFTFANQRFCQALGKTDAEVIGKTDFDLFPVELAEKYQADDRRIASTSEAFETVEENKPLNGEKTYVQVVKTPLYDSQRKVVGVQGIFWDITDKLNLESQLRQAQKMESIGQLAGGIAHDFNNILTIVHGHASLLLNDPRLSPDVADSAQQISLAAERAANLTRQLLTFSRRQLIQPKMLDLNETVHTLTKMLRRLLREDISLEVQFAHALPLIKADPGMVEQILLNLAVNARDAMPEGGKLTIQTSFVTVDKAYLRQTPEAALGDHVCLMVRDGGCGIPPENLPHLFEPFFTTKDVGKGTGLGLATVYGIVKQHRGWIKVESTVGRGTTFRVFFPSGGRNSADRAPNSSAAELPRGNETILVVEDESAVRNLVRSILEKLGYTVREAAYGKAALEVWDKYAEEIDLLLTDIVMPDGMSGRDLAQRLALQKPELKIVFTSGYGAEIFGKEGVLQEGINFLQKPYHPAKLARIVRDCLDQ